MHALIVKTSSMGDVLHTLPAVSDALVAIPGIRFDWVVEEGFVDIPRWHPAVDRVIPIGLRRWRKWLPAAGAAAVRQLRQRQYDIIIDAQGLIKSALVARTARGRRGGMGFDSVREPVAALLYQHRVQIPRKQHAVTRQRQLFACALGYTTFDTLPDYGIDANRIGSQPGVAVDTPSLVLFHATSWSSKHWPESQWKKLIGMVTESGLRVLLPWGSDDEKTRAHRLAGTDPGVEILPRLTLSGLALVLLQVKGAVAVDTGLGHLAAALSVPCVSIYGATNPDYTGTVGTQQVQLRAEFECAPCLRSVCRYNRPAAMTPACYATVSPQRVWSTLQPYL